MESVIWLSYDLGLKGDYESMYAWLDTLGARECGDSLSVFTYKYNKNLISEIEKELNNKIKLKKGDRIYIVYLDKDSGKQKGKFLFGNRKKPPWEGYSRSYEDVSEDAG